MGFEIVHEDQVSRSVNVQKPSANLSLVAQDAKLLENWRFTRFGEFDIHHPLTPLQHKIVEQCAQFYKTPEHLQILYELISQSGPVSLRLMDWMVTTYAKGRAVFTTSNPDTSLYEEYKRVLFKYKRRNFDPFRRSKRRLRGKRLTYDVFFTFSGHRIRTTVGQMNFVKWCLHSGAYMASVLNKQFVEKAMNDECSHVPPQSSVAVSSGDYRIKL